MLLVFVLAYRIQYHVEQHSPSLSLSPFVFDSGGAFEISLRKAAADSVFIGLCTEAEFKVLRNLASPGDTLCITETPIVALSSRLRILNATANFTGSISDPGSYRAALHICNQDFAKFEVTAIFRNPNTFLSGDIFPCLISKPIALGIFGLLFMVWIANWLRHFTLSNHLHMQLTVTLFLNILRILSSELELLHRHTDDSDTPLTEIAISFHILFDLAMMTTLLMAGSGWRIVYEEISLKTVASSFLFSAGVVFPLAALSFFIDQVIVRVCLVLGTIIVIIFYCWRMISGVNRAMSLVLGHLLVISKSGINPKTTPVYAKFQIFKAMTFSIVIYFLVMTVTLVIREALEVPAWTMDLTDHIATVVIIGAVSWAFRLTTARSSGYLMLDNCDNEKGEELWRGDIEALDLESKELREGIAVWEDGMALPSQPILVDDEASGEYRRAEGIRSEFL
jgi:hypothetical protein